MILDNKNHGKVGTELNKKILPNSQFSVLSGKFSIYGFASLEKKLKELSAARLLLTQWSDSVIPELAGNQMELRLKNQLNQANIARRCTKWLEQAVEIRSLNGPTQNLFHLNYDDGAYAIQGSSHFTASGLGETQSDGFDMNFAVEDVSSTQQLEALFENFWNEARDIKGQILQHLEFIASDKPAQLIYFITLFNIFSEILEDLDEEKIIRSKTGFENTVVWNKLYKFQKDGVLGAIDKIEKYNGCIIADSVGLGKTFEALAVIKYYELRNDRVLVLCPKKLRENWTIYTINDKRNLLADDRFNYDVLNHTDLSRFRGYSGEINLETINWGNYDLLVIDESHNFRNNDTKTEGLTRYGRLMESVIRSGVKTKVLMLSATPVNNRMNDLKNQVAFITEAQDKALDDYGIPSIESTLRIAQTHFNKWVKLPNEERSVENLLEQMNFDYFKLLDIFTIARSRKHIEKYYDITEIGKFPERLKPRNIKADIDSDGNFPPLRDVNMTIKRLNLGVYSPLEYVLPNKRDVYSEKYDRTVKGGVVFSQADREQSLIHLMRINLLKRMESSINSFALTVQKILGQIESQLAKIDDHNAQGFDVLDIEEIETESGEFDDFLIGKKVKILVQDMDVIRLRQDLEEDQEILIDLLDSATKVHNTQDDKLDKLKSLISNKVKQPINANNKKVIIFTAFSDTAEYLYENIAKWATNDLGLHTALITGSGTNLCTLTGIKKDLNSLLTNFSPVSKERDKIMPDATEEIDVLIATDCISEGQNLQDADFLVNYDIHWNPVRIIQRFGRVDRLGSKNDVIQLVNFWPNMELDEYINLEARVSGRMVLLDISATGEENVIDYDEKKQMNDLEYRRKQMKQLQDSVLDLEDMDGSVSITDMTLNDFRMDLSGFMKENLSSLEQAPTGFYAVVQNGENNQMPAGVIFCLKDAYKKVEQDPNYSLAPYFLVYVRDSGEIYFNHLQAKKSLDIFKKLCATATGLSETALGQFTLQTKQGNDLNHYQHLLERAIGSIAGKSEEKGIESLFSQGGTVLTQDHFQGVEDFEVVSYLIISEVTE